MDRNTNGQSVRVGVSMSALHRDRLQRLAERLGVSVSEWIRRAVDREADRLGLLEGSSDDR